MAKRMLIDATQPEETRVAVVSGNRLEEYDFETASKKQIKGNIYLAKVVRVEPSLQAAFVEYGGNRHGFLAFSEIHPDYYRIPVEDRQVLLAEEREMARAEDRVESMGLDAEALTAAPERPASRERAGASAVSQILPPEGAGEEGAQPQADESAGEAHAEGAAEEEAAEAEEARAEAPAEDEAGAPGEVDQTAEAAEVEAAEAQETESQETEPQETEPQETEAKGTEAEEQAPQQTAEAESVEIVGGEDMETEVSRRRPPSRRYKIQEVIKRRQVMLVQVTKEERGTKGAALTTRLSLAGRYCVLMPNTGRGGGISRKITTAQDRKKLREIVDALDIPEGISVIVRTAGSNRTKAEIKRDFDYLLRLWSDIRDLTLKSSAPALIYEEANLIKRSIRDLYSRDMDDILVEGEDGYKLAKEFMRTLMPSHAKRVQPYRSTTVPLFQKFQIESQIAAIHEPITRLKSGGYIVMNQAEALVAIDVNSGRATRERNIEETALQTNLEAADEIARQLRLRDLAGLIVIDFIDMESQRNQRAVEKRLKDALRFDRARIQLGRISPFGLLEMSRQRLRPSLHEFSTERCPHCQGTGVVRSIESTAFQVLRAVEEEGLKKRSAEIAVAAPPKVALYILNQKRAMLTAIEGRHNFHVLVNEDPDLVPPDFRIEVTRSRSPAEIAAAEAAAREQAGREPEVEVEVEAEAEAEIEEEAQPAAEKPAREGRRRRRGGRGREAPQPAAAPAAEAGAGTETEGGEEQQPRKRRRRGKRGGRRRRGRGPAPGAEGETAPIHAGDQTAFGEGEMVPIHTGDQAAFEAAVHAAEAARESEAEPHETEAEPREAEAAPREGEAKRGRGRRRGRGRGGNGARKPETGSRPSAEEAEPESAEAAGGAAQSHAPPEPRPERAPREAAPEPTAEAAAPESHQAGDRPKRRGWWQRLVE